MQNAVLILHILVAAAWFGHKLLIPRDVRMSVRQQESASLLLVRMSRAQTLGVASGLLTLGTGAWLMYLTTGFTSERWQIYAGAGAALAMFFVGGLVARPAWNRLRVAVEQGDTPLAVGAAKGFNRAINLESLLWILTLTMMII